MFAMAKLLFFDPSYILGESTFGLNMSVFFCLEGIFLLLLLLAGFNELLMIPWLVVSLLTITVVVIYELIYLDVDFSMTSLDYEYL